MEPLTAEMCRLCCFADFFLRALGCALPSHFNSETYVIGHGEAVRKGPCNESAHMYLPQTWEGEPETWGPCVGRCLVPAAGRLLSGLAPSGTPRLYLKTKTCAESELRLHGVGFGLLGLLRTSVSSNPQLFQFLNYQFLKQILEANRK